MWNLFGNLLKGWLLLDWNFPRRKVNSNGERLPDNPDNNTIDQGGTQHIKKEIY